ncbi:MAG: hypothetical protein ACREQ9_20285 [Candidatus Binatia bacterium]
MNERSLRITEIWFRLLADAARGTREAQETIRSFTEAALDPQTLARRIARLLPAGVSAPTPETIGDWIEGFWATTGVVPRARYLELLERYEALRSRLEEAEVTIGKLRRLLGEKGHEGDAQKVLDLWAGAVGETLRAQAEWMRGWIPRPPEWRGDARSAARPAATRPARKKARR